MAETITNVTNEIYTLLTYILQALSDNATALIGLLILSIIVYLAKDLITAVFGIFGSLGKGIK